MMDDYSTIVIEDSFKFERNALKGFSLLLIGIFIIGDIYWIFNNPPFYMILIMILSPLICFIIWYISKRIREYWLKDCRFIISETGFEIHGQKINYKFLWKEMEQIQIAYEIITYRDPDSSDTHKYNIEIKDKLETHLVELSDDEFHLEKIQLFVMHFREYGSKMGVYFKES